MIISDKNENANFYVTKDPHCSSLLLPEKKFINTGMAHIDLK